MLPQTWVQVAIVLSAVMPGFIYQASRRRVMGPDPDEIDLGTRVLRAVMGSAAFAGVYAIVLGPWIAERVRTPQAALGSIQLIGFAFLSMVVVVPWLAARVAFYVRASDWWQRLKDRARERFDVRGQWDPTPTAWDFAFGKIRLGWVRVLMPDGTWVGGRFGLKSFATGYPEPKELFLESAYQMEPDGTFTDQVTATGGVYVRCSDALIVDFNPDEAEETEEG
jgi:hypothetical protein